MKNRLKVLRAARDWTQADLAQALEVSRQTVNAIETGKYDPSLPLAFRLARLFGLSIEDIFQDQAEVGAGRSAEGVHAPAGVNPAARPSGGRRGGAGADGRPSGPIPARRW